MPVTRKQARLKVLVLLVGIPIGVIGAYYAFMMDSSAISLLLLLAYQVVLTIYSWPHGAALAEAAGWAAGVDMGLLGIVIQFAFMLLFCAIIPILAIIYWTYYWLRVPLSSPPE